MELPIIATVEVQGERVRVRAAPLSLVAQLAQAGDGGASGAATALRIVERCCRLESGAPVDPDSLSMDSATRLVNLAIGGGEGNARPDFPSPHASSAPGG